tara:strand:- start:75 stop:344 length:270 start_codon:yes stop_codon:yes gene_type:complete
MKINKEDEISNNPLYAVVGVAFLLCIATLMVLSHVRDYTLEEAKKETAIKYWDCYEFYRSMAVGNTEADEACIYIWEDYVEKYEEGLNK